VDNGTDKVYQYVGAASRTSGSQTAAATFALASGDTNPQGIADPPPESELSQAVAPVVSAQPSDRASGASAPDVSSFASRDAVFTQMVWESFSAGPTVDYLASGAFTPNLDNPPSATDCACIPAGDSGGQTPLDPLTGISEEATVELASPLS
jgi:hypothetical protein